MKKTKTADSLTLLFAALLLVGIMLGARLLSGDFTKTTFVHTPVQSHVEGYVVEKDGRALININRADKDMLMMISGIGEVLAGRIIEYREKNGAFDSVDELLEVKGIGEKTLDKMRDRIVCIPEEEVDDGASILEILGALFECI